VIIVKKKQYGSIYKKNYFLEQKRVLHQDFFSDIWIGDSGDVGVRYKER